MALPRMALCPESRRLTCRHPCSVQTGRPRARTPPRPQRGDPHPRGPRPTSSPPQGQGTGAAGAPSWGFPGGSAGRQSTCNAGDLGLNPGLGRSPGGGHGDPLQYPGLEKPTGGPVHGVAESDTTERPAPFLSSPCPEPPRGLSV